MASEYWKDREKDRIKANLKDASAVDRKMRKHLDQASKDIEDKIYKLYGKYATDNKLSHVDATKLLTGKEYKVWRMDLKGYVDEINNMAGDNAELLLELNTLSARGQLTRLQESMYQIQKILDKDYKFKHKEVEELLKRGVEDNYLRTAHAVETKIGFHTSFSNISEKRIKDIISHPWSGKHYSKRLWNNRTKLKEKIEEQLVQATIHGKDLKQCAKEISGTMEVSKSVATRLINTEHAYACAQGQLKMYAEFNVNKYKYDATLDSKTSTICQQLDGKIYEVKDAVPGVNFPPMHPNCRSGTVPADDDMLKLEESTRIARDRDGNNIYLDSKTTYEDYKKAYESNDWKSVIKSNKTVEKSINMIYNGVNIAGALDPYSSRADDHANRYYNSVTKMTTDCDKISENTGYRLEDINKVKEYIFFEEHELAEGIYQKFHPDYMMAQSWQRLTEGKNIQKHDLLLLEHELLESILVSTGYSQHEAHIITSKIYNYGEEALKYYASIKKHTTK